MLFPRFLLKIICQGLVDIFPSFYKMQGSFPRFYKIQGSFPRFYKMQGRLPKFYKMQGSFPRYSKMQESFPCKFSLIFLWFIKISILFMCSPNFAALSAREKNILTTILVHFRFWKDFSKEKRFLGKGSFKLLHELFKTNQKCISYENYNSHYHQWRKHWILSFMFSCTINFSNFIDTNLFRASIRSCLFYLHSE